MIITVDGPAGAGKSTVSRRLADELGLTYLNSGFIYRAVTLLVLESRDGFENRESVEQIIRDLELRFEQDKGRTRVFIGDREVTDRLKAPDVTPEVYRVANDGGYRELLVNLQRQSSEKGGVVAEGRDMGSVIFPEADAKFYVDASPEERARRSVADLQKAGHDKSFEEVLAEIIERDEHDRNREHAPLRVPDGGIVVNTDELGIDAVVKKLIDHVQEINGRETASSR